MKEQDSVAIEENIFTTLSIKVATQSSRKGKVKKMARNDNSISTATEDTPAVASEAAVKTPKAKKEPLRGVLPDGYVTPVGLAKVVTERGLHFNREGVATECAPQVMYSYIKNAPKEFPFPMETVTDSLGKSRQAVTVDNGIAWWIAKNARVAAGKIAAADKAAKKAAKAAEAPAVAPAE